MPWACKGLFTALFCYLTTTVTPCPQHPAPCPVPAAQTHQGCPGPLAAEQEAALPSCAVILSHPTARAQGGAALPHVLDTWTPPVPGRAHSPVFAVSGGLSCTSAHIPWFLVELIKCHQYWTHETVSVSQCSGDECLEATVPPWAPPKSHSRTCLWVTDRRIKH